MRKLEQQDRQVRHAQAREDGQRLELDLNEAEREALDAQRHDYFSDWTSGERERFKAEQASLWSTIPEKFRGKAEKYAKGGH